MDLKLAKNLHKDMLISLIELQVLSVFGSIILCWIYNKYSLILIPFLSILGFLLLKIIFK